MSPCTCDIVYFNSQPRKGADAVAHQEIFDAIRISTHSPARGLTDNKVVWDVRLVYFNSQPRKGADANGTLYADSGWVFQLTAPQGG